MLFRVDYAHCRVPNVFDGVLFLPFSIRHVQVAIGVSPFHLEYRVTTWRLRRPNQGVVGFKVSNLTVERASDSGVSPTADSFVIKKPPGDGKMFKFAAAAGEEEKMFWRSIKPSAFPSEWVVVAFRFRFERVGKNFKPMKLFAVTGKAVALEKGKPRRVV